MNNSPEMGFSKEAERAAQEANKQLARQLKEAADAMRAAQKAAGQKNG